MPRLIPVMVLSARANEDASIDALSAGADDYLPKPFAARELLARVAVQLARSRLRRAERAAPRRCFDIERTLVPSLTALVRAEVDAIRPIANARRVRVESFVDSGAGVFQGDGARMSQVVHNLLAHALACTQAGGNVLVECHGRGEFAEIVVRDNGSGLPAETLDHVFDPTWQMQNARAEGARSPGVWLGLAVIHRVVELHGGRIFAASGGHGLGAAFTVHLPLQVVAAKLPGSGDEGVSGPVRSTGRVFPKRSGRSP